MLEILVQVTAISEMIQRKPGIAGSSIKGDVMMCTADIHIDVTIVMVGMVYILVLKETRKMDLVTELDMAQIRALVLKNMKLTKTKIKLVKYRT